jgi:Na+/melibiose symporter-like transporter
LFFLNSLIAGVTTPGWFDMFAKLTSPKKRGRLVGFRNSLGGLGAFIGGFVLTWLLVTFAFPVNYAIGFFIAFVLQMASIFVQTRLIEKDPSPVTEVRKLASYLNELPALLKQNKQFSKFLLASAFLIIAMVPSGFFTVYVLRDFHADESVVGQYTLAMVAIQVVSAVAIGFIADRQGGKVALLITSGSMLLGAEMMVRFNMAIEYCPPQLRSMFIGLMNTILAPFYMAGLAGGVLSDLVGYKGVFLFGIIASVIGIYILVRYVPDPRRAAA